MSPVDKLRVAVLGCGRMGQRHAYNIRHLSPRAELVAIADPAPATAQWAQTHMPGVPLYTKPEDVFDLPNVDAVIISTTTSTHAALTLAAIAKNKHILLEKPISLDVDDSRPVVEAANKRPDLKVMLGFVRRYDKALNELHAHLASQRAGKPFILKSTTCDKYDPSGYFVEYAKSSGGIFMDCGIHDIDMARWLLNVGPPPTVTEPVNGLPASSPDPLTQSSAPAPPTKKQVQRVYATGTIVRHPELVEQQDCDNALGIIEFTNGASCTLHLSRTGMNGYESTVEVYGLEQKLVVQTPDASAVKIADGAGRRSEKTPKYVERFGDAFLHEVNAFVDCCLDNTPIPTTADDALQAAIIAKALTHSFHSGLPVHFDAEGYPVL